MPPTAVQVVHGTNEPFRSLSNLYSRTLRTRGWRVVTIYLTDPPEDSVRTSTEADEIHFLELSESGMKGMKLGSVWKLRRLIRQADARMVIAQRYKPVYLSLMATVGRPIPVYGVGHAFGVLKSAGRRFFLNRFRRRFTMFGVSEAVAADMRKDAPTLRVVTMLNGVDAEAIATRRKCRTAARSSLGIEEGTFVFANVGRLHDDKDQPTLIRAFARIAGEFPQARLLLIGTGKREAADRELVAETGLQDRVRFAGMVPDAASVFAAFDVYVSSSDREPFGIVLVEAMLAGVPVISTDCGGSPESLGETAAYFRKGDDETLALRMREAIGWTPEHRRELGAILQRRAEEHFSFPPFAERLARAIDEMPAGI